MIEASIKISTIIALSFDTLALNKPILPLKRVSYIHHPIRFKKYQAEVQALSSFNSEVNTMTLAYTAELGFKIWPTNIGAQKIYDSTFQTFEIVLASFQVDNKLKRVQFFQKTFLLTNISRDIILGMFFLTFSNAGVLFVDKKLTWWSYLLVKTLPITKWVQIISRKEFAIVALDLAKEAFIIHIASLLLSSKILIHLV